MSEANYNPQLFKYCQMGYQFAFQSREWNMPADVFNKRCNSAMREIYRISLENAVSPLSILDDVSKIYPELSITYTDSGWRNSHVNEY